ncbi:hypothetical protein CYY_004514 [Polysphondylium violaceum]|uniref:EGF-like domain-containing protein n=1 Tax=Polysphondylium violaceum TaxID=133409 RepID=A0A8J4PY00_9MYCE|nr:hypothetical protein CYY_004514 [Polysphondylium violaceum]
MIDRKTTLLLVVGLWGIFFIGQGGAQQAVLKHIRGVFKGLEEYADSTNHCEFDFVAKGPIDLTTNSGIEISCGVTSSQGSSQCQANSVYFNISHYILDASIIFAASPNPYTNIELEVTKSTDSTAHILPLVNPDGSAFTYTCESKPSIGSFFDSVVEAPAFMNGQFYQSNVFTGTLKMNPLLSRAIPYTFHCPSADYDCQFSYSSQTAMKFSIIFADNFQNIDSGSVIVEHADATGPSYSLRNPLDNPTSTLTVQHTEFKIAPLWGYFIETARSSVVDQFPPINLYLEPLYGTSLLDLKFMAKGATISPRQILGNGVSVPFLNQFPDNISSGLVVTPLLDSVNKLVQVKFDTNAQFQTKTEVDLIFTAYYPYGLVSYDGNKRHYEFPVLYDASAPSFKFNVFSPDKFNPVLTLIPTVPDSSAPTLDSLEIILLNATHSVLRLGASDSVSGVYCIRASFLPQDITKKDLVSGTFNSGIYEVIIPSKKSIPTDILQVFDYAEFTSTYTNTQLNFLFDTDFIQMPSYLLSDVSAFSFSSNQIDVTSSPNTVILSVNISQTVQQLQEYTSMSVSVSYSFNKKDLVYATYNPTTRLYEMPLIIPARIPPGPVRYFVSINNQKEIESDHFIGKFGNAAKLNVVNSGIIDVLFPIVTVANQVNGQSDPLVWELEFYDISGIKAITVGISSEYDVKGKNFTLNPKGETTYQYTLTYPVDPSKCRPMKYWISYVYTEDILGNKGQSVRYSNSDIHPFFKLEEATSDIISLSATYCTQNILDTNPPSIISLTILPTTNTSVQNEQAQVRFQVTDDTLVSVDHLPVCFFTARDNDIVSVVATVFSNDAGIVEFTCDFVFPFTFGPRALLSIYGISDIYFNFIGYTTTSLKALGSNFHPTYTVPSTSGLIVIESTSSLEESSAVLYIYGRGFKEDASAKITVEVEMDTEMEILTPTVVTGSVLVLNSLKPSSEYKIKVVEENSLKSSLVVTIKGQGSSSSDSSSSPSSSASQSSSFEFITPSPEISNTPKSTPTLTPTITQSPSCKTDCGASLGYGVCKGITCVCNSPHSGLDCLSTVAKSTIEPNVQKPSVNLTLDKSGTTSGDSNKNVQFTSFIGLISISELDNGGNDVVSKHIFINDQWINVPSESNDPDVKTNQFKYIINNSLNTTIYSTVQVFSQAKSITFGKQQLQMNPSTVKFTFNITSYPFSKSTNTLQLVMGASVATNEESGCSYQEFISDDSESQYLKIQIDQVSLFGRFIGYGIIDGREESITNSVVNQADEISTQQTSNSQQSYIGLNIRYFQHTALLDPDFSVLIDTTSASDQSNSICTSAIKSKLSTAQIAGIVVGGVVFLVVVAVVVIYRISKKSFNPTIFKLRKLASR